MSTTTPTDFSKMGPAVVNDTKLNHINEWYKSALGNSDKASTVEEGEYYQGEKNAYADVLMLFHFSKLGEDELRDEEKDHTKRNVVLLLVTGAAVGFAFNSPAVPVLANKAAVKVKNFFHAVQAKIETRGL